MCSSLSSSEKKVVKRVFNLVFFSCPWRECTEDMGVNFIEIGTDRAYWGFVTITRKVPKNLIDP